jgi:hypothetical protein
LTNASEAFDGIKAFIIRHPDEVRILYELRDATRGCAVISIQALAFAAQEFINWVRAEAQGMPGAA